MLRFLIVLCIFWCGCCNFKVPLIARRSSFEGSRLRRLAGSLNHTLKNLDDFQYYAEIYVGTPAVKYHALIDTGAHSLMLSNTGCSCPDDTA